ncbi:hypothetical protein [Candidatus Palauibacter sp.]|uniref:hypothetical protein n=1 Tax=Candidatus Palauibacter sp. TaxID=3101350 RepID=UPI003CC5C6F2
MAVRVGSAFIDFQARNARFLAATKANAEAMRRKRHQADEARATDAAYMRGKRERGPDGG